MSVENEKLEVQCFNCNSKIILTFNTSTCPICESQFNPKEVHKFFYDYESKLINSNSFKNTERTDKIADGFIKTGSCISNLGCIIFLLPLALFGLYIIFKILST